MCHAGSICTNYQVQPPTPRLQCLAVIDRDSTNEAVQRWRDAQPTHCRMLNSSDLLTLKCTRLRRPADLFFWCYFYRPLLQLTERKSETKLNSWPIRRLASRAPWTTANKLLTRQSWTNSVSKMKSERQCPMLRMKGKSKPKPKSWAHGKRANKRHEIMIHDRGAPMRRLAVLVYQRPQL